LWGTRKIKKKQKKKQNTKKQKRGEKNGFDLTDSIGQKLSRFRESISIQR